MILLDALVSELIDRFPLPWTVECDWCFEIYDAGHRLIIKLTSALNAHELVSLAERIASEDEAESIENEEETSEPEV